jgi:hypothetical protein
MLHLDFTVTLGKSDPRWGTPAGCAHEVNATFPEGFSVRFARSVCGVFLNGFWVSDSVDALFALHGHSRQE